MQFCKKFGNKSITRSADFYPCPAPWKKRPPPHIPGPHVHMGPVDISTVGHIIGFSSKIIHFQQMLD